VDERSIDGRVLALVVGDITAIPADAIVNAANDRLAGGGGVDGAIHRVGGPTIMAELASRYGRDRRCPTGSAVVTGAGDLPASWVIHAVGPVWRGGGDDEPALLASVHRVSLGLAGEVGARTVTMPAISCGVYGYPVEMAAAVAITTVSEVLAAGTTLERATFVLRPDTIDAFRQAMVRVLG
jgi:O-acetyl-ADP-ribose deacetylase (regulator of RNase III)